MIKRFAITFIDSTGLRVHYYQNTSRYFFDNKKLGESHLKQIHENNSIDTLNSIFGINPQFKVLPIECYPNGDAKQIIEN